MSAKPDLRRASRNRRGVDGRSRSDRIPRRNGSANRRSGARLSAEDSSSGGRARGDAEAVSVLPAVARFRRSKPLSPWAAFPPHPSKSRGSPAKRSRATCLLWTCSPVSRPPFRPRSFHQSPYAVRQRLHAPDDIAAIKGWRERSGTAPGAYNPSKRKALLPRLLDFFSKRTRLWVARLAQKREPCLGGTPAPIGSLDAARRGYPTKGSASAAPNGIVQPSVSLFPVAAPFAILQIRRSHRSTVSGREEIRRVDRKKPFPAPLGGIVTMMRVVPIVFDPIARRRRSPAAAAPIDALTNPPARIGKPPGNAKNYAPEGTVLPRLDPSAAFMTSKAGSSQLMARSFSRPVACAMAGTSFRQELRATAQRRSWQAAKEGAFAPLHLACPPVSRLRGTPRRNGSIFAFASRRGLSRRNDSPAAELSRSGRGRVRNDGVSGNSGRRTSCCSEPGIRL